MGTERGPGARFSLRVGLAVLAVILLVVIVFQNSQSVSISILFWDIEGPLIWSLLGVAVLGFLVGLLLPRFRR